MDYHTLKHQFENGTIFDLAPYVRTNERVRKYIASKGQCISELLAYDEPNVIVVLINNGYASEYYEMLKNHKDEHVREALAQKGLWPEDFIEDEHPEVRAATARAHTELMRRLKDSYPEWNVIKNMVENDPNVTAEDLNYFLSLPSRTIDSTYEGNKGLDAWREDTRDDDTLNTKQLAYKQKARAMAYSPSLIEQTMTAGELYQMGSPAWVNGLSIEQIANMNTYRRGMRDTDNLEKFDQNFEQILEHSYNYWEGLDFLKTVWR